MKSLLKSLSLSIIIALVITQMATCIYAGTIKKNPEKESPINVSNYEEEVDDFIEVKGGATKAKAINLTFKPNGPDYVYELKTTKKLTYFKFKTQSYNAYYSFNTYAETTKPVEHFFRRANDSVIKKGASEDWGYTGNLKPNTWYYLVVKNTNKAKGSIYIYTYVIKDEDRDTKDSAKKIVNATTYNCSMAEKKDVDYYKFVPSTSGKYTVIVRAAGGFPDYMSSLATSFLRSDGSVVVKKSLLKKGQALTTTRKLTKGKTYYIKVSNTCRDFWNTGEVYKYKVRIQKNR